MTRGYTCSSQHGETYPSGYREGRHFSQFWNAEPKGQDARGNGAGVRSYAPIIYPEYERSSRTEITKTVMLSRPPRPFASSINCRAASEGA